MSGKLDTLVTLSVKSDTDECGKIVYMQSSRGESFFYGRRIPYSGLSMLRNAYVEPSIQLSGDYLWKAVKILAHVWGGVEVKATKHCPCREFRKEWYICRKCTYDNGKQVSDNRDSFTGKIKTNATDDIGL